MRFELFSFFSNILEEEIYILLLLLKNTSEDVLVPKEVTPISTSPHDTWATMPGVVCFLIA